jgi:hypothetical protein
MKIQGKNRFLLENRTKKTGKDPLKSGLWGHELQEISSKAALAVQYFSWPATLLVMFVRCRLPIPEILK